MSSEWVPRKVRKDHLGPSKHLFSNVLTRKSKVVRKTGQHRLLPFVFNCRWETFVTESLKVGHQNETPESRNYLKFFQYLNITSRKKQRLHSRFEEKNRVPVSVSINVINIWFLSFLPQWLIKNIFPSEITQIISTLCDWVPWESFIIIEGKLMTVQNVTCKSGFG